MHETGLAEILEDVGEQEGVRLKVEVVVLAKGLTAEGVPDSMRVLAVLVGDVLRLELAVEGLLGWELGFVESGARVHVLVKVDALLQQEV